MTLQEKILSIIADNYEIDYYFDGEDEFECKVLDRDICANEIIEEIRTIAMDYRWWFLNLSDSEKEKPIEITPGTYNFHAIPEEDLFEMFIKERYGDSK